jgi:hypothetical protein
MVLPLRADGPALARLATLVHATCIAALAAMAFGLFEFEAGRSAHRLTHVAGAHHGRVRARAAVAFDRDQNVNRRTTSIRTIDLQVGIAAAITTIARQAAITFVVVAHRSVSDLAASCDDGKIRNNEEPQHSEPNLRRIDHGLALVSM